MRTVTSNKYSRPQYDAKRKLWFIFRISCTCTAPEYMEEVKYIDRSEGQRLICDKSGEMTISPISCVEKTVL